VELPAKLTILADAAKYDASCASSGSVRKREENGIGHTNGQGICHSFTPDGRCVSLLKILLTNYCIYDCAYCVNRVSSDTPRARFTVGEVVNLTLDFYKRNYIEGLFLSSGIIQSADYTMEQLIAVARELRTKHKFGGYIHLKGAPGVSRELLREAGRYADRLSINIEMPTQRDLDKLAPAKVHSQIETSMAQIHDASLEAKEDKLKFAPAGQTTQMVIGATPASDSEILAKSASLYRLHDLRRVYYSAFSPIPHADSALPVKPAPLIREHRLYQADWLLRFYGFTFDELTTPANTNLPLNMDPKLAWALRNRAFFPVDVNAAPKEALLRVPGLGARAVARILRIRRYHRLDSSDLEKLRVPMNRARHFLIASDVLPAHLDGLNLARQLSLFGAN
jgi:putative DNA modification/repair radical SAM protein